ncbi:MAG: DNA-processing protein DprA, partial [Clostridiales bacterium]|nr:DNA-processing protein DprA [Clostridiales bacterium]
MYTLEEKICISFAENGISSSKFFQVWNLFEGAEQLVAELPRSKQAEALLGSNYVKLKKILRYNAFDEIIDDMNEQGVCAVTWFSPDYPPQLRDIDDPPCVLFCKGNVKLLATDCFSVIGTRKVSSYGRRITRDFT